MTDLGRRWRRLEGWGLGQYYRLISWTARCHNEGLAHWYQAEASGRPVLWALWHGIQMPFMAWGLGFMDPTRFVLVVVGDERYDVLAGLGHAMGARAARVDMGGNPMAAGRQVLNVIQALKRGQLSFIFPDGPDGPPFQAKPGVFFIARKARALVLPLGIWTRQAYAMPRWDRFLVPLPFARLHAVVGAPIDPVEIPDEDVLAATVTASLNDTRRRAQLLAGVRPWP